MMKWQAIRGKPNRPATRATVNRLTDPRVGGQTRVFAVSSLFFRSLKLGRPLGIYEEAGVGGRADISILDLV